MDRPALLALWSQVLGSTPPRSMSQPLLRRILAWELQAKAQGGLPAAVRSKLASLGAAQLKSAAQARESQGHTARLDSAAAPTSPKLRPGGRLLREWNGTTHVVDVVEGGFLWRGTRHRSLSAIAQAITGAHWSGPRFFGLQEVGGGAGAGAAAGGGAAKAGRTVTKARSLSTPSKPRRAA